MDLQTTQDFIARGEIVRGNHSIPVTIVGHYPHHGQGRVQCKIVLDTLGWPSDFGSYFHHQAPIELRGKTEQSKDIWSPEFEVTSAGIGFLYDPSAEGRFTLEGVAPFFVQGDLSTFAASSGETHCIVSVTPTALAIFRESVYSYGEDGTIIRSGKERKGICWHTSLGQAELIDNYEYLDEKVGFENVLMRFQKYQIIFKLPPHRQVISLKSLLIEVKEVLNEPLLLLSFLSRKSITWYEAKAEFIPKDDTLYFVREAYARYYQQMGYKLETANFSFNLPVDLQPLKDGGFQTLLDGYLGSPLKDTIRQTIEYVLVSYEIGHFEARLGLIYAALESLVDGLSKHHGMTYLLGSSKFKKLSKELEEVIITKVTEALEEVIQEKVSDEDIAKRIIGKLPELRRPAIRDRLLKLLKIYNLDKVRMNADISSMVEDVLSRRNTYIHTGVVDHNKHRDDLYLLQELIELWILRLLHCPDAAINPEAFRKMLISKDVSDKVQGLVDDNEATTEVRDTV